MTTRTCATCPYFQQYEGESRGVCRLFDFVARENWERTQDCDNSSEVVGEGDLVEVAGDSVARVVSVSPAAVVVALVAIASQVMSVEVSRVKLLGKGRKTEAREMYDLYPFW